MKTYLLPLFLLALLACEKEKPLTAGKQPLPYTLPQGNAAYDDSIMAIYSKFGSYVLYRYTQDDYAYNYFFRRADTAAPANPAYIDTAFSFLKKQLIDLYPESFLRRTMPYRILLAAWIGGEHYRDPKGVVGGNGMLAFGWADSTLLQKTPEELLRLRGRLHAAYCANGYSLNTIKAPREYLVLQVMAYSRITNLNRLTEGVIAEVPIDSEMTEVKDFLAYVEAITSMTTAAFEAKYLVATVDRKGIIRKKYNAVLNYYKNSFDVDLTLIGNMP